MDWLTFSIVIALLLVSAFFSASETALTGASRASMLRLSKQGNRDAAVVSSLFVMRLLMKALGIKIGANQPILSPTERLRGAVDLLHHEGKVEKLDRDMFGGLLDLRELQVSDVMVHRTEMVMINADLPPEELVREVLATEYTRIPLWREKPENIIGVLHAKDLLRAIRAAEGDSSRIDVSTIALPPWFVPEMRSVSEQLKAFRRRKTHFALVVDEYGEVEGVVT